MRLRDVAIVSASDAALMTRLENVALAPAPAPGRRMRLDFAEIRSRLEATGIPTAELNYSGSSVVVVASADAMPAAKPKSMRLTSAKPIVPPAQIKRAEQIMADAVRRSMHEKHKDTPAMFIDISIDPSDARVVLANAAQGFEVGAVNPKSDQAAGPSSGLSRRAGTTGAFAGAMRRFGASASPRVGPLGFHG